jgi:putative transposase
MMLQVLSDICAKMPVQLHAFVFMGNHFHLVVTTIKDVSISQLMQEFEWQVSVRYNRLHHCSGTLWQGPFKHTVWEPTAAGCAPGTGETKGGTSRKIGTLGSM